MGKGRELRTSEPVKNWRMFTGYLDSKDVLERIDWLAVLEGVCVCRDKRAKPPPRTW